MLRVVFRKVREGQVDRVREWMAELNGRSDEVLATFAQEGVRHEAAYLLQTLEGPVLVYAVEAEDVERARRVAEASTLPIDLEHRRVMGETLAGPADVEPLYECAVRGLPGGPPGNHLAT